MCEGFSNVQGNIWNGMRWSTAHAYLRPAMERPNLDVAIKANVKKVSAYHHTLRLSPLLADPS